MNIKPFVKSAKAKRIFNRIVAVPIVGGIMLFLCFGIVTGIMFLIERYGVEERTELTDQYSLVTFKNGDVKIKSKNHGRKIRERFDDYSYLDACCDSVVFLMKDEEEYTFSTKSGVLSRPYTYIGDVGQNRPWVACVNKNNELGFMDIHTGNEVIPCQFYFDHDDVHDYYYNYYTLGHYGYHIDWPPCFDGDYCVLRLSPYHLGVIDTAGKVLIRGNYVKKTEYHDMYLMKDDECREYLYSKDLQCLLSDKEEISVTRTSIVCTDSLGARPVVYDLDLNPIESKKCRTRE